MRTYALILLGLAPVLVAGASFYFWVDGNTRLAVVFGAASTLAYMEAWLFYRESLREPVQSRPAGRPGRRGRFAAGRMTVTSLVLAAATVFFIHTIVQGNFMENASPAYALFLSAAVTVLIFLTAVAGLAAFIRHLQDVRE